jgi:TolB-like protein/Flp pilus assembly protein TadD
VLPFTHPGGVADADAFSAGLTQELLNLLTRVRDLRVASSASSLALQGSRDAAPELARRLGVDLLLEGSVRRDKDRLRVSAELVDAHTGFRLWSQIYDRRLADGFAAQEDVARQVAGALELVLAGPLRRDLTRPSGESLAAYDLYLKGRAILAQPSGDAELADAARLFQQAIATDGTFAVAYAGLCDAWLARYDLSRAAASFSEAERACRTALEKEPQAAEVHESTGRLYLASGDAARAERELSEAAGLATNPAQALLGLARAHEALGRLVDAEADLARARAADPNDWRIPSQLGAILFRSGRADEAARAFAEVTARTPESPDAHAHLGAALLMAGDFAAATVALERSVALGPSQVALSNLGTVAFYQGRFETSAGWFRRAAEAAPGDHELWGNLGDALTFWPGHAAEAAEAYRRAVPLAEKQLSINRADAYTRAALARYQARLGQAGRARREQEEALREGGRDMYVQYNAALVSLQLGAPDEALAALERAVALGYQQRLLAPDAALAPLRGRARFEALAAAGPAPPAPSPAATPSPPR